MRKIVLLIFIILHHAANGQTLNAVKLSDSLIKTGITKVAITTYDFPDAIKKLQEKATKSLKANPQWADKYVVLLVQKGSTDIPKMLDAYGLTEGEFEEMISGFKKKKQAILSDTSSMTIRKRNGLITFYASKKISLFNYLSIDTQKSVIHFDNLIATKELPINGKFYAPILNGFETFSSRETTTNSKSGVSNFGFSIGINSNDTRPNMTLIYGKGEVGDTKFISITLL